MYGKLFKAFRQVNDMSLKDFSSWIGCSTGYLTQIEKGAQIPSDGFMLVTLENLKVSEDFFYGLMVYAEMVEEDLKINNDLPEEQRELILIQEIKLVILKKQHKEIIEKGYINRRRLLV